MKEILLEENRIKKIKGKSVESLFRTLSKNNYRMLQMIDRKGGILISLNAIIVSIIISIKSSGIIPDAADFMPVILLITCPLSMILSLFAIRPFAVRSSSLGMQENNLVNIDVIQELDIQDYKAKMNNVLRDDNRVYDAMTEDLFFIGKNIHRKHKFLQWSAAIFVVGFLSTAILRLLSTL
ncbi:MAG: Pycsar system effector family protein [Bacteroidota bacterium]